MGTCWEGSFIGIVSILIALLIFGVLIFIHELGHFLAARSFHVKVKEFAVGMGPKIFSFHGKKSGTLYSIRLLPIGGFTSMAGEDEESDDVDALNRKPVWQRAIITAAGAFMNLALGFLVMTIMVCASSTLTSTTIFRFTTEKASSELSGLQIGDTVTAVDGTKVHVVNEMVYEIMRNGVQPISITVKRNGQTVTIPNVTFPTIIESGVEFGTVDFYVTAEEKTIGNVIKHAFYQSTSTIKMIWGSLFDLVTGRYGIDQLSGPVGVTSAVGEAVSQGPANVGFLFVFITMNLGIVNLLPLPALDGGRLIFLLIEAIRGKPIKPEYEGYIHFAGIVLLMVLMVFLTYKDITKLFL